MADLPELDASTVVFESEQPPPGVQPVRVYTGVKATHTPTGLSAFCNVEKSQLNNKAVCIEMLRRGLEVLQEGLRVERSR